MKVFDQLAEHAPLLISITESVPSDFVFVLAADLKNYLLGREPQKAKKTAPPSCPVLVRDAGRARGAGRRLRGPLAREGCLLGALARDS